MVNIMKEVLEEFSSLLRNRLVNNIYTTEASVEFTFLLALLEEASITPHGVILEYPHPKISRAEIDIYVPSTSEKAGLVVELKYDRQIPSGRNAPRPQKAGRLFNDIFRLAQFNVDPRDTSWLIYFTDEEMAKYLGNPNNDLVDFFELPVGDVLMLDRDYVCRKSETFRRMIGGSIDRRIRAVWSEKMPKQHQLRAYEVLPTSTA